MIVLTMTFVPYEQFDLYIILKVTAALYILNLADLIGGTNLPQASYQTVLGVLMFASPTLHLVHQAPSSVDYTSC